MSKKTNQRYSYFITTNSGKTHEIEEDKINKYGWDTYAKNNPGATVRMRDTEGNDYDVPLTRYDDAIAENLHAFRMERYTPVTEVENEPAIKEKFEEIKEEDIKNEYVDAEPIKEESNQRGVSEEPAPNGEDATTSFRAFRQSLEQPSSKTRTEDYIGSVLERSRNYPTEARYNTWQSISEDVKSAFAEEQKRGGERAREVMDKSRFIPSSLAQGIITAGEITKATDIGPMVDSVVEKVFSDKEKVSTAMNPYLESGYSEEEAIQAASDDLAAGIQRIIFDEYKKQNAPKDVTSYILGSIFRNNLASQLAQGLARASGGASGLNEQLKDETYAETGEKAGLGARVAAGVGTLVADAPVFGGLGSVSANVAKGITEFGSKQIAKRIIGASGKAGIGAGSRYVGSSLTGRMVQGALASGGTLGTYDALSEMGRQLRTGTGEASDIAGRFGHGFFMGAALAPIGVGSRYLSRNMSKTGKMMMDAGAFVTEAELFNLPNVIENPWDFGSHAEGFAESAATLGLMKGSHKIPKLVTAEGRKSLKAEINARYNSPDYVNKARFSKEELADLKELGYDLKEIFKSEEKAKIKERKGEESTLEGRDIETVEPETVKRAEEQYRSNVIESDTEVLSNYVKMMNDPDVPIELKAKMAYRVEGRFTANMPRATWVDLKQSDKGYTVTTHDAAGNPISRKTFDSKREAENIYKEMEQVCESNSINIIEELVDRRGEERAITKALLDMGVSSSHEAQSVMSRLNEIQRKQASERTAEESAILSAYELRVHRYQITEELSDGIRAGIERESGLTIADILQKPANKRSLDEVATLARYRRELLRGAGISTANEPVELNSEYTGYKRDMADEPNNPDIAGVADRTDKPNRENKATDIEDAEKSLNGEKGAKPAKRTGATTEVVRERVEEERSLNSERLRGKDASIDDVVNLYGNSLGGRDYIMTYPEDYAEVIDRLETEREMAIAWSKGEPAVDKPDNWEYWKEREGLSERVETTVDYADEPNRANMGSDVADSTKKANRTTKTYRGVTLPDGSDVTSIVRDSKKLGDRILSQYDDAPQEIRNIIEPISDMSEPIDVEDVVYERLASLRSPNTRHKLILNGVGAVKGVAEELGLPAKELQSMIGMNAFALPENGGISLQKMAESIAEDINSGVYAGISNADVGEVRDMLIEAIRSSSEPADISYHRARRRIALAQSVYDDYVREVRVEEKRYAAEEDAYNAYIENWLIEAEKRYNELPKNYFENIFADEERLRQEEYEQRNIDAGNQRGSKILLGERLSERGRAEEGKDGQGLRGTVGEDMSRGANADAQGRSSTGVAEREVGTDSRAEVEGDSEYTGNRKDRADKADWANRSDMQQEDLSKQGVVIDEEYKHVIDNNAIRHTLKKHGGKNEEKRGQVPIVESDFDRVADVVENYDGVEVLPGKTTAQRIIYHKAYPDGTVMYVEEQRVGRKELAAVTMWKKKIPTLTDANRTETTQISDLNEVSGDKDTIKEPTANGLGKKSAVPSVQEQIQAAEAEVNTSPTAGQSNGSDGTTKRAEVTAEGVHERVSEWENRIGAKVRVIERTEDVDNVDARVAIEKGLNVSGWYDVNTGDVCIYAPNVRDVREVDRTIVHEVVSHKGLRGMLGEKAFNKLCDKTWDMMSEAEQAEYESYPGVENIEDDVRRRRAAADEYISHLAEGVDLSEAERSTWRKVMDSIMDFLKKLYSDIKLTEKDLEEIIKASYRRMRVERERGDKGIRGDKADEVEGVKPIGRGVFGDIYDQFRGKAKEALAFLKRTKQGDLLGVFHRDEIGDIDLVWGDEKSGLSHINSKHVGHGKSFSTLDKAVERIEDIIKNGDITFANGDKVVIKNGDELVTLRRNIRDKGKKTADKNWILTAYNEKAADNTSAISVVNKGHAAPTTAYSRDKDTTKMPTVNELGEKNAVSSVQEQVQTGKSEAYMPNVYTYINGISEGNSEVIREWEREFRDYISNLGVENIASIEHSIGVAKKKLERWVSDNASADYKAYDFITRRLEHRLRELTKGDRSRFSVREDDIAERKIENVVVDKDVAPKTRQEAITILKTMKQPFFNVDQGVEIYVSNRDVRHIMQFRNSDQISVVPALPTIINRAVKIGEIPVSEDELNTTKTVSVYYCPIKVGENQYSGRMIVKEYYEGNQSVDELHLYNVTLKKSALVAQNVSPEGLPIYPTNADVYKVKDLIHNTQEHDKVLLGLKGGKAEEANKAEQLRIIQETNPAPNDVNTWVRSVDDIKTFEESLKDSDYVDYAGEDFDPSYTWDKVEEALRTGKITVYSSLPIVNGAFVTPSRMEAESYGDGSVYRAEVRLSDVAWIDPTQGQLATENSIEVKREASEYRFRVANESQEVFVSNAARAVEQIKQEKATPEQWLKMIEKQGGLKVGEDKWIGLSDWLRASDKKSLTKQELLDFINDNKIQIEEVKYSQYGEGLIDEAAKKLEKEYKEIGWTAMQEKYPEIDEYFELYNGEILWSENRASIGEYEDYIFDIGILNVLTTDEAINETRERYTTEGLERKREIALTVPTIEPWNVHDEVHFGDAGQGRAIAWVRFGETTDGENNRVLVIDEIQSKRHQEGREKGYIGQARKLELAGVEEKLRTATKVFNEYRDQLKEKYDYENLGGSMLERIKLFKEAMTESERIRFNTLANERADAERVLQATRSGRIAMEDVTFSEYDGIIEGRYDDFVSRYVAGTSREAILADLNNQIRERRINDARKLVPDAPFEKNWSELAMKRMLRLAADEGFDKVAWTTGEQQAERYDIGTKVNHIHVIPSAEERYVSISPSGGRIIETPTEPDSDIIVSGEYKGKSLAEVYGKSLADKIMSVEVGSDERISGNDLRIGAEGMKGFYDKMLPSFVNKYVKKWGAKVSEVELPNVEESGRNMWSVDVTPEMKRDVKEGQTMFRFIGEKGAGALDRGEEASYRLDNLTMAREMERKFGEKKSRIEKLRSSKPIEIDFNNEYELNRDSAKQWLKDNIRGEYVNKDTGETIEVSKVGISKVTSHSIGNVAHLKSMIAIPELIENSIFIAETPNEKGNEKYDSYRYYVCGLKIDGDDYTAKVIIGVKQGKKYYDHSLTEIEKGNLIEIANGFTTTGDAPIPSYADVKDSKLVSILQVNDRENAKRIKVATGWERGADGKWRYEVSDGKFDVRGELHPERRRLSKEEQSELSNAFKDQLNAFKKGSLAYDKEITEDTDMADIYVAGGMPRERAERLLSLEDKEKKLKKSKKHLDDYLDDEELYAAYPELREIEIAEGDPMRVFTGQLGGYNPQTKTLTLYDLSKDTLLHEVQHIIQHIEGFATGGSAKAISEARRLNNQIQREVENLLNQLDINEWLSRGDIQDVILRNQKEGRYFNLGYAFSESLDEITGYALRQKLDEANRVIAENNRMIGGSSNLSPSEHYRRLGGEVEARNVSRRMGMSDEERMNSLAADTEDVSRADQIFIMEGLGVSESAESGYSAYEDFYFTKGYVEGIVNAKRAVNSYKRNFKALEKPIIDIIERSEDLYGYALGVVESDVEAQEFVELINNQEEISGVYAPKTDRIIIFAWRDGNPYLKTFHENVHRAVERQGGVREFKNLVSELKAFDPRLLNLVVKRYKPEDIDDEIISYSLEAALSGNAIKELQGYLSDKAKGESDKILNYIGYDESRNSEADAERFVTEESSGEFERERRWTRGAIERRGRRLGLAIGRTNEGRNKNKGISGASILEKEAARRERTRTGDNELLQGLYQVSGDTGTRRSGATESGERGIGAIGGEEANKADRADSVRFRVPWKDGESLADAISRVRKKKNLLTIELSDMDRRRDSGKEIDEHRYAEVRGEKDAAEKALRYMEVGPEKPMLAEGEKETDASYVTKMEQWRESLLEWKGKKYDEDEYMNSFLKNVTGSRADMSDEELSKILAEEKEKRNTSIKEMKRLIRDQIRERRRNIEVSNWEDEVTIKRIKDVTTEKERELIPHILEGSYRILPSKDNRYAEYTAELRAKSAERGVEFTELEDLDMRRVESSNYNAQATANSAGLRNNDIVEYAVDSGNAAFYVSLDGNRVLLQTGNGDLYPLNVYDVRYLYWLYDRLPQEKKTGIGLYGMGTEQEQLLGMFLRGEAEWILPSGIREYKEAKEYDPGLVATVKKVRDWYDEAWEILNREGMTYGKESIDSYVTHIWDLKKSTPHAIETFEKFMVANQPRAIKDIDNYISTNTPYMRTRAIASIADGMEFGLVPKYKDITDIMRDYGHRMNEAVENRRLVNFVKGLRVNGMDAIRETGRRNDGVYVLIDNNALRGYEVHRDVKPVLDIVFGKIHTIDNVILQNIGHYYDMLSGVMKKLNLSLSFFHHFALTETSISMMNPWRAGKTIFKNIMWDAAFKGHLPAFNDVELTRDAVKHFVQLGATQDYAARDIKDLTTRLAEYSEGKPGLEELATIVDFWNKGMDTFLWEYLHDGYKVYGYGKLASEIRAKAKKESWDDATLEKALDEAGQLINDTYGGQHWDMLGWSPNTVRWARRALLSPDWTLSTLRQALAPFGIGQLYDDDKFWKKWFKNDPVSRTRKKYGRAFWLTAALFFIPLMNGLNAYFRKKDEEEELLKAEEERKTNPDYKSPYELAYPNGMKWWDYTMLGNTVGHQTHLFGGRYEDGKEIYVRWGKQFRELPELFIGRDGVSFPQPMIDKIAGKLNPVINLVSNLTSGYSLNGFQNSYMKNKRGWERELARVHVLISSFMPYSIPTDEEKEFKLSDLTMPSTKGFSTWKAIDKFKVAIASGDINFVGQVYDACVMNGLNAEELLGVAIKQIEVAAKKEMIEGVADVNDAIKQYDNEQNPIRRTQLKRYIIKQMSAQDYKAISREELLEEAQAFIEGGVTEANLSDYDAISTSEDLLEDWRLRKAKAGLKPYWDEYRTLEERNPSEAIEYYERHIEKIEKYRDFNRAQRSISKFKKQLGKGNDVEVMGEIRAIRKRVINGRD